MKSRRLVFGAVLCAALAGGAAEPKRYGFDKPIVIVAEEFDAYFRDADTEMTKAGLEAYADAILAGGKVTHVFWCPVAGRANFAAKATDPIWTALDNPDVEWGLKEKIPGVTDAICCGGKPEEVAANKRWAENVKKLNDAGIDPYKVWIDRTHEKGVEAWISIRMTDLQYCFAPNHFRTPSYFAKRPELMSKPSGHGGGSPNLWEPEVRDWLKKVIVEVAERYSGADGFEFDFVSVNDTPVTWAPEGRKTLDTETMCRYIADLSRTIRSVTRNPKVRTALRVMPDSNEMFYRHLSASGNGTDWIIPYTDPQHSGWAQMSQEWHEVDRVSPRVIPGRAVTADLGATGLAGWIGMMRGWEFPGVLLAHVRSAPQPVRDGVFSGELIDWKRTAHGPLKIDLKRDAHMLEWKGAWADWRVRYPWKLDRPWKYEFALQEGTSARRSVKVRFFFKGAGDAPDTVFLNGYRQIGIAGAGRGNQVTYSFAPDSILNWRNHIYIPAQDDPDTAVTVMSATVEID